MSHPNGGLLPAYNSLTDKHLAGYFNNTRIRRHLLRVGLITRSGSIVPDKEYKQKLMRKEHQRHMRECLAHAIFHKVLDIERHHQTRIKRRLEDFAQRERVNKIKVERSRRYEEESITVLSPKPPSDPRNGYAPHSGPEMEPSESSESLGSSRPNTAPGKMQRPVRLQPISNGTSAPTRRPSRSTRRPSRSTRRSHAAVEDTEQLACCTLDRDMLRRAAVGRFSSGISPYRLPVINNFITPVPPPPPPKGTERSIKGTPSGTVRGRKLRPTTAPSIPMESRFQKTSTHSNVSVTMVYFGKSVHLSHDDVELRDEVKVFQQHCGGENICVYRGKLMEGECFRFVSRRHRGFPFSLTFFLNGMQVERLSSCCEFRHRGGSRLGGKHGHFGFTGVVGASPCYRCIIAMGLDKKPTPPPKRTKGDSETDGFMAASSEMVRDEDEFRSSRSCECENIPTNREQRDDQSKSKWGGVQNDYEADFEGEDEKAEEGEPRSDHHSDGEEGCPESPGAGNSAYTDSEAEEDHPREKRSLSRSSRSATFSSRASKDDSGSDTEEVKESIDEARVSLASCAVSKAELREEDGSLDLEEHVRVNGGGAASLPGDENHHPSVGESMDSRSTGDAENMTEIQTVTTAAAEAETTDWECCQDAMERDGLEDPPTGSQTVMEGAAPDEEEVQQVELERAKSVQEKLAEAIMKEAHCSSEPELSDTSTDEEEESSSVPRRTPDQNLMDTELSAALSLPWTLCTKAPKDQEASAESPEAAAPPTEQAGCEAPVKQDTGGSRTGSHSDLEDGGGLEPLQEAEDPLPDAEVGDEGDGPDETMETLETETVEWEQNEAQEIPGEAQSPHFESNFLAVAEEKSCERECNADDDKSIADQVENEAEELIETDEKKNSIITEGCNVSDRGGEPEDEAEDDGPTERDEGQVTLAEGEITAESSVVSRESCGGEEVTTTQEQEQAAVEVREDGQTETTEQDITETAEGGSEEDKGTAEKPRTMQAGNEHDDQEDGNIMKGEADEAKCGTAETEIVKDEETNDELRGNMEIEEGGSEVIGADNEEEIMEEVSGNGTQEVQLSTTSNTDVVEAINEENGEAEDERVLKGAGLDGVEGDSELRTEDTEECNRETKLDSEGRGDTEAEGQVDQNPNEQEENKESNSKEEEDVEKPEDLENSNDADREIEEEKSKVQGEQLESDHGEVLLEADHATDRGGDTRDDGEVIESGVECESAEQVRPEMEKEVSSRKTEGTKSPPEESLNDAEEPEQAEAAELDVKQATQDDSDQPEEERDTDPDKMADLDMDPKPADTARAEHEVSMAEGMVDEIKGHELAMSEGLATTTKTMEFHGQQADEAVDLTAEDMITKEWKDTDSSEEEKGDQMDETMSNYHATQSQADDQLVTFQNKRSQPMIGPDEEEISTAASGDGRNLDATGQDSETEPEQSEIKVDTDLPSPEDSVAQLEPESKDEESGEHRASQGTSDVEADVGSGPESEARSSHTVSPSPTAAHGGYRPMVARGGWNAQSFPLNAQQAKGQLKYIQAIPVKASRGTAAPSGEPQHTGAEDY